MTSRSLTLKCWGPVIGTISGLGTPNTMCMNGAQEPPSSQTTTSQVRRKVPLVKANPTVTMPKTMVSSSLLSSSAHLPNNNHHLSVHTQLSTINSLRSSDVDSEGSGVCYFDAKKRKEEEARAAKAAKAVKKGASSSLCYSLCSDIPKPDDYCTSYNKSWRNLGGEDIPVWSPSPSRWRGMYLPSWHIAIVRIITPCLLTHHTLFSLYSQLLWYHRISCSACQYHLACVRVRCRFLFQVHSF